MLRLRFTSGQRSGETVDVVEDVVHVGRADTNELVLRDDAVFPMHAKLLFDGTGWSIVDVHSERATYVDRSEGGDRTSHAVDAAPVLLIDGDVIRFGAGDDSVSAIVHLVDDVESAHVVVVRRLDEIVPSEDAFDSDPKRLRALYAVQKRIGGCSELGDLLSLLCDEIFLLVRGVTHVTVVLRDDDGTDSAQGLAAYVPVLTRVRGMVVASTKPIPITRSVYRKVIAERAAVLAADAPSEVGQTESLLSTHIRSVIGVPLWRGEDILGVVQVDNRESPGVFTHDDLELLATLAHNASLAVANCRLLARLQSAEERLKKENSFLKGREQTRRADGRGPIAIVGQSSAMDTLLEHLKKVVDTRVTVLIEGETGVGKELVASALHYQSRRRERLFVAQNCGAMPDNLLESELFGHKKGAFTGAHEDKKGLFEVADGGTLFLDEVSEMPLSLQAKLLRVLQEGEIRPVGSNVERRVDVRIVAATNRNLEGEVSAGRFREDLYYRLKVFPLRVPPLRERREDIPLLADHFLKIHGREMGKPVAGYSQQAMEALQAYDFPGNVRELQNEVQRIVIQVEPGEFVTPDLLSPRIRQTAEALSRTRPEKGSLKDMMDQVERVLLLESLREHGNNKSAAARTLGITREGLHKKLRQFGMT